MTDPSSAPLDPVLVHAAATPGPLRAVILDLWQRVRIDWSLAADGLTAALRAHRELPSRERRLVAEVVYGLIRHLRRIDEALAAGGLSGGTRARDELRLLAYLVLECGLPPGAAAAASSDIDWSAVAVIDSRLAAISDPARRLARRWSLPDWLAAVLAAEGVSAAPGRYATTALVLHVPTNLHRLASFRAGGFEPMDEGSQLVAELVAPPPRGVVVDFCAGAGGKTLALAAAMGNTGRVIAADVDGRKLAELRKRAHRAGVTTIHGITMDPEGDLPGVLARLVGKSSRVLLDAPCSGIGALRRHPETRWRIAEADLEELPRRQLAIAERALPLLEPGGWLIYATCTLLAAENEEVVAALRARHRDLSLLPIADILGAERASRVSDPSGQFLTLLPHRHTTDGFFAAVLRRDAGATTTG